MFGIVLKAHWCKLNNRFYTALLQMIPLNTDPLLEKTGRTHLVPLTLEGSHMLPRAFKAARRDTWELSLSDNVLEKYSV